MYIDSQTLSSSVKIIIMVDAFFCDKLSIFMALFNPFNDLLRDVGVLK